MSGSILQTSRHFILRATYKAETGIFHFLQMTELSTKKLTNVLHRGCGGARIGIQTVQLQRPCSSPPPYAMS